MFNLSEDSAFLVSFVGVLIRLSLEAELVFGRAIFGWCAVEVFKAGICLVTRGMSFVVKEAAEYPLRSCVLEELMKNVSVGCVEGSWWEDVEELSGENIPETETEERLRF